MISLSLSILLLLSLLQGFQFITRETWTKTVCSICGLTMFSKNLNHHVAIKHLFDKYLKSICSVPGYRTDLMTEGVCPVCPNWKPNSKEDTRENIHTSNKIRLVKHYSDVHSHIKIQLKSNPTSAVKVSSAASSEPGSSNDDENPDQKLFCKLCKRLVASKRLSDGKIRMFSSGRSKCDCNSKKTVICRYCGTKMDCVSQEVEKHLDSEEHKQKEKIFALLSDVYYKARGIDENSPYDATNYKFFILALKAFAVQNEGITVMNCLSLLQNILDMSLTQYNDLYRHVDQLVGEPVPTFLCYPCNYATYGPLSALSRHTLTQSHKEAVASLTSEFLSCTECAAVFSTENIMSHSHHSLDQGNPGEKRKRQHSVRTQEEEEEVDNFIDEILKSSDDEVDDQQQAGLESNEEDTEKSGQDEENNESGRRSEDYYYFCLDCEKELPGLYNSSFHPISFNDFIILRSGC